MKVEFVDLKAQYRSIKGEIDAAIADVLANTAFIGGVQHKAFEQAFASYLGAKHCIGVANGTDAIFIALKTLGIGQGDEVITVANSFIATSEAITQTGARVVFVDCDEKTYTLDVKVLEKALTPKTKAIVPVHLYGQPADMGAVMAFAEKHRLKVVEDCAQAHGAEFNGRRIGTLGHMATFSFFPGKNLGAYGDAGAVVTNDDKLADWARRFANHGRVGKYDHDFEGINSRLDNLQAAILGVKLKHLEDWTKRRIAVADRYDAALKDAVGIPFRAPGLRHVYHLYVVRVKGREKVQAALAEKGIATGVHYPIPLPFLKAYAYLGHKEADFPVSAALQHEILSLPIHGSMTDEEVDYVIAALRAAVGKA